MLYKNVSSSSGSVLPVANDLTPTSIGLHLVSETDAQADRAPNPLSPLLELAFIASRRCSSFFAEAAVLVLVFGILDYFMLKGRIEIAWIVGALSISVGLLACSVAMDFNARRWIKAHP